MAFPETWNALQANLAAGAVIPNWTAHRGTIGEPFTITDISATVVMIDAPGAETPQRVPQADFEEVYDRWNDYVNAALARSEFSPLTRYSKYIISILHWLEGRMGGRLP